MTSQWCRNKSYPNLKNIVLIKLPFYPMFANWSIVSFAWKYIINQPCVLHRIYFTPFDSHIWWLPSGKRLQNYGKSPCSMGKSFISMAIFNSLLLVYRRVNLCPSMKGHTTSAGRLVFFPDLLHKAFRGRLGLTTCRYLYKCTSTCMDGWVYVCTYVRSYIYICYI